MAEWKACICGDDSYLGDLPKAFAGKHLSFEQGPDGWIVSGGMFASCCSDRQCREIVEAWLLLLNGSAALLGGSAKPISLNYVYFRHDDGTRNVYAQFHDTINISDAVRYTITKPNGAVEEFYPAKPLPTWVKLAQEDENLKRVLELIASRDWSWVNIYRVFEIVRADVGGAQSLLERGWITRKNLNRFTRSANHPDVAGLEARHGHVKEAPPQHPMEFPEGVSIVKALVHQWVAEKISDS